MKKWLILSIVLLMSGCLGGYSPESRFYNLQPRKASVEVLSGKIVVGVNEAELPDYLSRQQIVSFNDENSEVGIAETDRWAEPLETMLQRVVTADIANDLPNALVLSKSSLTERFDLIVDIQIVRFDMVENKDAVLEAWWYIKDGNRKLLYRGKSNLRQKIDGGYEQYVSTMSNLVAKMCADIAEKIAKI